MLENKKDYKAWIYLGIPLFLLLVFTFYPLLKTVLISIFPQYNHLTDNFGGAFGFNAYFRILSDEFFYGSLKNTMILVFISVPASTILALFIAVGLNSIKPLQKIFQTIFFIPYVTNTIAIGLVFAVIFNHGFVSGVSQEGLINTLFKISTNWVGPGASYWNWMFVVLAYSIWNGLPFKILIFIAGLQNISKQYYDAAKVDAAPKNRVFRKITVPLLSPMISYVLITSLIGAFKAYESVIAVAAQAGQGLDYERWTVVAYVYDKIRGFGTDAAGVSLYSKGAAAAVVLFVIILLFTALNLWVSKKRVHF